LDCISQDNILIYFGNKDEKDDMEIDEDRNNVNEKRMEPDPTFATHTFYFQETHGIESLVVVFEGEHDKILNPKNDADHED